MLPRSGGAHRGAGGHARSTRGFATRLGAAIGGPLGCSHVLTLAQAASARPRELALDRRPRAPRRRPARRPGERVFQRSLAIDGVAAPEGGLELVLQQADVHCAPAPADAQPLDRLARHHELRVHAHGRSRRAWRCGRSRAAERSSESACAAVAWRDRDADVAWLDGPAARSAVSPRRCSSASATTPPTRRCATRCSTSRRPWCSASRRSRSAGARRERARGAAPGMMAQRRHDRLLLHVAPRRLPRAAHRRRAAAFRKGAATKR